MQIPESIIQNRLKLDNPWWDANWSFELDELSRFPRRRYFEPFLELVLMRDVRRAVVVLGPRRVGKTVMVTQAIGELLRKDVRPNHIFFASLDTPAYSGLPLERLLELYRESRELPAGAESWVFFDEVQYLRDWEKHLKSLVDTFPSCRFVVTGSAAAALKLKSDESGAGRFTEFILPPLTFIEYLDLADKQSIAHAARASFAKEAIENLNEEFLLYLDYGGFPEAVYNRSVNQNKERYLKSDILDKVLLRDIPSLYGISDIQELNSLFNSVAYNSASEFSLENLSQQAGIAKNTIKKYLEYLEAAYLIKRVRRIDQNAARFQRERQFKIYLTNPCMRSVLFGALKSSDDEMGHLVETALFSQLMHGPLVRDLHYARWDRGEVDIVFMNPGSQQPVQLIEVKWSDRIVEHKEEIQGALQFSRSKQSLSDKTLIVTTKTVRRSERYADVNLFFYPASLYAYSLGELSRHGSGNLAAVIHP